MPSSTVVIGVGNDFREDDAAGLHVVRKLRGMNIRKASFIESGGDGAALASLFGGSGRVIIVDAVSSGAAPGTIHRLDVSATGLPAGFTSASTHLFSVAQAIELGRALGTVPQSMVVYGIEAERTGYGTDLTNAVAAAVEQAVRLIMQELSTPPVPA